MDQNELNEVGTLLHIMETIVTNHPKLAGIARTCQRRLEEINQEHLDIEMKNNAPKVVTQAEIKAAQHTTGKLSLKDEDRTIPGTTGAQDGDNLLVERRV